MTLARLLAAPLVICSALVFAQQKPGPLAAPTLMADASQSATVALSEPWKFIPNQPTDAVNDKTSRTASRSTNTSWSLQDRRTHSSVRPKGRRRHDSLRPGRTTRRG